MGLSSLGRAESHVVANLDKVLGILHRLSGHPREDRSAEEPLGSVRGRHLQRAWHGDMALPSIEPDARPRPPRHR